MFPSKVKVQSQSSKSRLRSVFRVGGDERLVFRQEFGFGDEADIFAVAGDDGHVEVACLVELLQHGGRRIIIIDEFARVDHQVLHQQGIVFRLVEDGGPVIIHHEQSFEMVGVVGHHEQIALAAGDEFRIGAEGAVDGDGEDVGVDDFVPLKFAKGVFVFVVGFQVVLLSEVVSVDGVFFKGIDADIGAGGGNHQRDEQGVATGEFSNQEDGGQGSLHDAGHDPGHACEYEVGGGDIPMDEVLGGQGHKETDEGADEQGGSEHTAHAAGGGGQGGGKDLQHEDADNAQQQRIRALEKFVERGVGKQMAQIPVDDGIDAVVTLPKEGREDEDESAEGCAADERAHVDIGDAFHLPVQPTRGAQKEDRHQSCEESQHYVKRDVTHQKGLHGVEGEHHRLAPKEERHHRTSDGGDQQRQDSTARQVEHQHLEGEDECRNGCLEDGRHRRCRATRQQQGGVLAVHLEETRHVGTDGRARQHNGRLQSYGTAKTHRDGTRHHGGIDVVKTQLAVTLADSLQHDADPMTQVISHNLLHKKQSKQDANGWKDQIQILDCRIGEDLADRYGGDVQQILDDHGGSCPQDAYQPT